MAALAPAPVVLSLGAVTLEPQTVDHASGLFAATRDAKVWSWLTDPQPGSVEEMRANVERTLERQTAGRQHPFTIVVDGVVAGSTSFYEWDTRSERIEVGYTMLGTAWWRTAANTSCKLLLMGHAFEELGYGRLALRTDHLNTRSQAAIARIGGVREGVLRRHVRRPDGTWRDTVYFSILRDEWPDVRERLTEALERR